MHRLAVLCLTISVGIGAVLGGCGLGAGTSPQAVNHPTGTVQSDVVRPVLAHWGIGDRPVVSSGDFTLAANIVIIDGARLTVLYSFAGPDPNQLLDSKSVQLTDETGQLTHTPCMATQVPPSYPVSGDTQVAPPCTPYPIAPVVTHLAQLGQLQMGAITYSPRTIGALEQHVLVSLPGVAKPLDVLAARLIGPPQEDPASGAPYRLGYLDQAGYRVSFNGYGWNKGDQTAAIMQASSATGVPFGLLVTQLATQSAATQMAVTNGLNGTSTPALTAALMGSNLAGGKPIRLDATLRIEDLQSHGVYYLYVVFLSDGEVKASLVQ
jgi:hypothetical protein